MSKRDKDVVALLLAQHEQIRGMFTEVEIAVQDENRRRSKHCAASLLSTRPLRSW
jgi:hypothetical protein